MVKVYEYSYFGGAEVLTVRHAEIGAEIDAVIASVNPVASHRAGKLRYSPKDLNDLLKAQFRPPVTRN